MLLLAVVFFVLYLQLPSLLHGRAPTAGALFVGVAFWLVGRVRKLSRTGIDAVPVQARRLIVVAPFVQVAFALFGGNTGLWDALWPPLYSAHALRVLFPGVMLCV